MGFILSSIYVFLMAVSGRAHGAAVKDEVTGAPTGWVSWGRAAGTALFTASAVIVNYQLLGVGALALAMGAMTLLALNTGHGRFFMMNGANTADPNPEWIEKYIVLPLYWGDIRKPAYSWVCMAVKGFGVGLAAFPFGLALAFLWPASYYVSTRFSVGEDKTCAAEWLAALCAGIVFLSAYLFLS